MKKFKWDEEKNNLLKKERGVSFEEILNSKFLGAGKHQARSNQIVYYSNMKIMFGWCHALLTISIFSLKPCFRAGNIRKCLKAKKV